MPGTDRASGSSIGVIRDLLAGEEQRESGRRPEAGRKSPAAFRTISEVSGELDVPQHVLRFWETKFGQIRPLKRGGGRRYYRPEDVVLLRSIRDLLYVQGYTIRGVQKLLRENGARGLAERGSPEGDGGGPVEADPGRLAPRLEAVLAELEALRRLLAEVL